MNSISFPTIIHEPTRQYAYLSSRKSLVFKLTGDALPGLDCSLIYWNHFRQSAASADSIPMSCNARDRQFSYFEVELPFAESARYIRYTFEIRYRGMRKYLNRYGLFDELSDTGNFDFSYANELDVFSPPRWAADTVCYQIFPERFFRGNEDTREGLADWSDVPTRENFFGGDLRGIIEKFPHLLDLGVNLLYLTPVFDSPSNHKYDTRDYFAIDPGFGNAEDLRELVALCHSHDVRIILDGVFNHCGYEFFAFQDLIEKGEQSPYRQWFFAPEFPLNGDGPNYECPGYYKWMPKIRYATRDAREYFLTVGEYWIREFGIDGWRLDIADEVDYPFWQEFRTRIKNIKPDALLLGETWTDGSNLLAGDQMDSVMNYHFRDAVLDFIGRGIIDADEFNNRLMRLLGRYKKMVYPVLYNLLGSHDTPRLITECGGDRQRALLAVVVQMTFPGMPAVYYGDEIGMEGENDPLCRGGMEWDSPDRELLSSYRRLITIRKEHGGLRTGRFIPLLSLGEVYVFMREAGDDSIFVALNAGDGEHAVRLPLPKDHDAPFVSLWTGETLNTTGQAVECLNPDLNKITNSISIKLNSCSFEMIGHKRSGI